MKAGIFGALLPRQESSPRRTGLLTRPDGSGEPSHGITFLAGVIVVLGASVGLALAGTDACTGCLPTQYYGPITLIPQPPPPPPICAPDVPLPPITLFRQEVAPPVCLPPVTMPPVTLFPGKPQPVEIFRGQPQPLTYFRQEPLPPRCAPGIPNAPVTLFRQVPTSPRCAPPTTLPPISLFQVSQPPCAVCAPCPDKP